VLPVAAAYQRKDSDLDMKLARKNCDRVTRGHEMDFLVAALRVFTIAAAICNGATPPQEMKEPIWPTKEWQMSA
jgi:hypothetical protein